MQYWTGANVDVDKLNNHGLQLVFTRPTKRTAQDKTTKPCAQAQLSEIPNTDHATILQNWSSFPLTNTPTGVLLGDIPWSPIPHLNRGP